ncbi:MAG: substrate-binding domain-containing protein [Candidatus Bathyarchaeota archaeon]|nr:substrate-binding domain-containing protein [Candidatus Bathyarchaeota archaeon]
MAIVGGFKVKTRAIITAAILTTIIIGGLLWNPAQPEVKQTLLVSTTTSLYETGVLEAIKSRFEASHPEYNVSFISQGTGLAIETAKRGDADLILVHSPTQEQEFLETGCGVNRKIFAYNFFIIVGPESDPAGIKDLAPVEALVKLSEEAREGKALWVSRGDNSGTHSKEKALWKATGLDLESMRSESVDSPWYIEAGSGMTVTLQLANEVDAYTLTDVATFLKNSMKGNIELVKIVDSGKETLNVYSAIICNPDKNDRGMFEASMQLVEFLIGDETQEILVDFGEDEFGSQLFRPWIPELDTPDSLIVGWVKEYAYIDGSECPSEYRHNEGNLYR